MAYQKIVQIGAGGNLGAPVLAALVASGKFEITVVARHTSTFTAPDSSVKVVKIDFSDHQALVNALKGNNAVAITLGDRTNNLEKYSKDIIDAAIEAGVKRVLPSEFGSDLHNSPGRDEPIFGSKHKVDDYLIQKSSEGAIEFTAIANGPFFDWGLTHKFLGFDIPAKRAIIYNGGDEPVHVTTLGSISAAIISVLSSPDKFKNKHIRISDFYVSQNEVLSILEAETGSKFAIQEVDAEKLREDSYAGLGRGEFTQVNLLGVITASVFGKQSGARWGQDDTESLGIPKKDLTEEIRKVL